MKFFKLVSSVALIFVSLTGCAEEGKANSGAAHSRAGEIVSQPTSLKTELKDGGAVLTIGKDASGAVKASYFFTVAPTQEDLASRIVEMMGEVEINEGFIQKISPRLRRSRVLGNTDFSLPLTDVDGTVYQFNYISDIENSFFVINYTFR